MPPGLWPLVKLYPNQLFGVIRWKTHFFLRSLRILCSGPFSNISLLNFLITFCFDNWLDTTFKVQNIQWRLLQICTDDKIFRAFVSMGLRTGRSWCVKNTEQILYRRCVSSTCYADLTELAQTLWRIRSEQLATQAMTRICFWVSFGKGNQLCVSRNLHEPCLRIWLDHRICSSQDYPWSIQILRRIWPDYPRGFAQKLSRIWNHFSRFQLRIWKNMCQNNQI